MHLLMFDVWMDLYGRRTEQEQMTHSMSPNGLTSGCHVSPSWWIESPDTQPEVREFGLFPFWIEEFI